MTEHEHNHDDMVERKNEESYGYYTSGIQALMKGLHAGFVMLAALIVVMLVWFFTFGGFFTVNPQETILVFRFGKLVNKFTEDWHWVFPYPVDSIVSIPTSRQKITVRKFMPDKKIVAFGEAQAPEEQGQGPLIPGKDGYLLTADANIIHTEWEINYQITNPEKYYLKCLCPVIPIQDDELLRNPVDNRVLGTRGPRTLLKSVLEDVVIKVTASQKVEDSLYKKYAEYSDAVATQYIKAITDMDIGVTVESVLLTSKSPPGKTIKAFYDVISAEQEKEYLKDQAKSYAIETVNGAQAEASQIKVEADAYRKRVISEVRSESFYFEKLLKEYKENPDSVLVTLYNNTLSEVLPTVKDKFIITRKDGDSKQQIRLKLNPEPVVAAENKKTENKGDK